MTPTRLIIEPLPTWLDLPRLLGVDAHDQQAALRLQALDDAHVRAELTLPPSAAADVAARLRGLGIDGLPLAVRAEPPLARSLVRAARLRDARARRDTTPPFLLPGAIARGEGRYSLTPEALAVALGNEAAGARVLDACCGSGGNSIGFARAGAKVEALELAPERLAEARHNARIYGVESRIEFVAGDARTLLPARTADILFIDPPWGESYDKRCTSLESFPLLAALLAQDLTRFDEVWLKLPASFRVASIPSARARGWFGVAPGDRRRIKFVLVRAAGAAFPAARA